MTDEIANLLSERGLETSQIEEAKWRYVCAVVLG